jgi:AraC-like DNA-binding protein
MSPLVYLKLLRVNRAKKLLQEKDARILEIGLSCGFDTYSSFVRVFRKFTGVSPSMYRKTRKSGQRQ